MLDLGVMISSLTSVASRLRLHRFRDLRFECCCIGFEFREVKINLLYNYGPLRDKKLGVISRPSIGAGPVVYLSEHANGARTEKMNMTAQFVFSQNMRLGTASRQKERDEGDF
jgi:hypothetical protein